MKLPKPRKIIAEKYVAGLSLFKSKRSPIKLSANESALGPSPKAVKSYNSIGKGFVRYPDSDGTFFRKVLGKKFCLDSNRIILGSGSDQIFELVCKLFLNKGDEVVVTQYSFIIYRIYSRMCGATVKFAKEENFTPSAQSILDCVNRKKLTFVLFVAIPISSITSNIFSDQKLLCLIAFLSQLVSCTACVAANKAGLLTLNGGLISYSFWIIAFEE